MTRCVLITGATGFVGSRLMSRVSREPDTKVAWMSSRAWGTVENGRRVEEGRLTDAPSIVQAVLSAEPTEVHHLATHFRGTHKAMDIDDLVSGNLAFGTAVAEAASVLGSELLYTGSAWQFFEGRKSPVSLYAAMKSAFESILDFYEDVAGLSVREAYLFDTYGPGDTRGKLVQRLFESAVNGSPITLGSPEKLINLTHVDDVVDGLILAMSQTERRDWVIRTPESVTLAELVHLVETTTGMPIQAQWDASSDRPREMRRDWDFGTRLPGATTRSLSTGLSDIWLAWPDR